VCVETSFANLKVAYKDFHASSPSQYRCEDFFHWIWWSVIPW